MKHGGIYIREHTCRLQHDSSSQNLPEKPTSFKEQVELKPLHSRNISGLDGSDKDSSPDISDLDHSTELIYIIDVTDSTPERQQQQSTEDGSSFSIIFSGKLNKGDVIELWT